MNNLFGINTTFRDLANDFNGFVREVVEELQTVSQEPDNNNNEDNDSQLDEEQAIEEELRHQLLALSDDEDGTGIRASNAEEPDINDIIQETQPNDDSEVTQQETEENNDENKVNNDKDISIKEEEEKQQIISLKEHQELHSKYIQLKQNYRKSMLLVEKYQIHNKSLKETLNEQMIIREQQFEEMSEYRKVNDELNRKVIKLQTDIESMNAAKSDTMKDDNDGKISIFEDDTTPNSSTATSPNPEEMVIKSVKLNNNNNDDDNDNDLEEDGVMNKDEVIKLKRTLQKASVNMKELKKRYKKVKDDLCGKIEEFDQLKSQYVTYKISSSKKVKELQNKLKDIVSKQREINNDSRLNKELQTILNAKFCLNDEGCKSDIMNPLHFEMIGLLNGCIETMSWMITTGGIDKYGININIDDNKSDSVVIVDGNNNNNNNNISNKNELSVSELETIKMNVISLREIICEFIGMIQQWLKILNDAIDRKQNIGNNGDETTKSLTEEFQNID